MSVLNWTVIRNAAAVGLGVIVPLSILASLLFDTPRSWLNWLFFGAVILGFGLAGIVAGWTHHHAPLLHGGVAAMIVFVVAQTLAALVRVLPDDSLSGAEAGGDRIRLTPLVFTALIALCCGVAGALGGDWMRRRLRTDGRRGRRATTSMNPGESAG